MQKLENYLCGKWITADGEGTALYNSVNGQQIALASTKGLDFKAAFEYGRQTGGQALRKMTFHERGRMLKALALHLHSIKDKFYPISYQTGATKIDSWIDIEGGIGNLFANASLRKQFADQTYYVDGDHAPLSKGGTFIGHHIMVPKEGVAVHINAYNFPIWGMLEKIAVNLLAGMPAIVKPATVTSFLTHAMVKEIEQSRILPKGALQLVCGSAGDMLDHVMCQDVVTFTGSAATGQNLKTHPKIISESVPFNMEADSLNSSVLGPDVKEDSEEFELFVKEVAKEITIKAGQKCTAVRRILVPENLIDQVQQAVSIRLAKTIIGDPTNKEVRMGALAGKEQLKDVQMQLGKLLKSSEIVFGDPSKVEVLGAKADLGAFMSPVLLRNDDPYKKTDTHNIEAFGPVSTIIPYKTLDEAIEITKMGLGSLCCSIVTNDAKIARDFSIGAASYHGRILTLNAECAKESTGHGSPMPLLVHGGPGRAGGGEEMGGIRGVKHYLQRTAIQGSPSMISAITEVYQYGAKQEYPVEHLFQKHFEDLKVGQTYITHKHTITDADIVNFANVSGDHFYAHTDETSLEGTIFERRVAHGYYILSKAAGMFVDPRKGPVLLNYGIDEARFTKPVYPGTTIGVKLTVKEKTQQEKRDQDDIKKGIVKFMVEVYDQEDETVALATILTMVKNKDQKA